MEKYRYTMIVKKVVVYDEKTIEVMAANETEAKKLAKKEAQYRNWVDVDRVDYYPEVYSYSCNPVDTDTLSEELTEDQLNDWFDNVDRKDLGKMFTMPYGWSEQTDMNDFVDYCDNIWDAFTIKEKKEMYEKYHTLV